MFLTCPFTVSSGIESLIGNLFVGVSAGDQAQNLDFPRGQGIVGGMFGQLRRRFQGNALLPGVYRADRLQEFLL